MREFLLHPRAGHAVGVQQLVEVSDDQALDVEISAEFSVLDTLDSCRDSAKDPHLLAAEMELPTLYIRQLEAQLPDEIIVNERGGGSGEVGGHQRHEGVALAGEDVLLVSRAVVVARSEHSAAIVGVRGHRWFLMVYLSEVRGLNSTSIMCPCPGRRIG